MTQPDSHPLFPAHGQPTQRPPKPHTDSPTPGVTYPRPVVTAPRLLFASATLAVATAAATVIANLEGSALAQRDAEQAVSDSNAEAERFSRLTHDSLVALEGWHQAQHVWARVTRDDDSTFTISIARAPGRNPTLIEVIHR